LLVFIAIAAPQTQQKLAQVQAASKTWRVTVVDAAKYTANRDNVDPVVSEGTFNLRLELRAQYLGPEGNVAAPVLKVVDQDGKEFRPPGNVSGGGDLDFEASFWIINESLRQETEGKPDTRPMTPGKTIGLLNFYIVDLPRGTKELRLGFGDIAPFRIRAREPRADGQVAPRPK